MVFGRLPVQINRARHEWRSALLAEFFADGRGGITHLVDRPQQLFFANSKMPAQIFHLIYVAHVDAAAIRSDFLCQRGWHGTFS